MRIALCSTFVSFARQDLDRFEWLRLMLLGAGHQVEGVYLPWADDPETALQQLAAYRWIDLQSSADRIICLASPAHVIPHSCKVVWLAGDSVGDLLSSRPDESSGLRAQGLRAAIDAVHTAAIRESRHVFATSAAAADRLRLMTGVAGQVLDAPDPDALAAPIDGPGARWTSTIDRLLS